MHKHTHTQNTQCFKTYWEKKTDEVKTFFRRLYICTIYLCTSEIFKVKNSHNSAWQKLRGEDQSKRSSDKNRLVRREEDVRLDFVLIFNDDPFTVLVSS
jgi:hypothetical protein